MISKFPVRIMGLGLALITISGCSIGPSELSSRNKKWNQAGALSVGGPVPSHTSTAAASLGSSALGFTPSSIPGDAYSLEILRDRGVVRLLAGTKVVEEFSGQGVVEGAESLPAGSHVLQHKQRSPLWYAPARYFIDRHLSVPPEGDRARYLRGALGDFALFIDATTQIHSGPVASAELSGMRLSDAALAKIYYSLDVGATIVVR